MELYVDFGREQKTILVDRSVSSSSKEGPWSRLPKDIVVYHFFGVGMDDLITPPEMGLMQDGYLSLQDKLSLGMVNKRFYSILKGFGDIYERSESVYCSIISLRFLSEFLESFGRALEDRKNTINTILPGTPGSSIMFLSSNRYNLTWLIKFVSNHSSVFGRVPELSYLVGCVLKYFKDTNNFYIDSGVAIFPSRERFIEYREVSYAQSTADVIYPIRQCINMLFDVVYEDSGIERYVKTRILKPHFISPDDFYTVIDNNSIRDISKLFDVPTMVIRRMINKDSLTIKNKLFEVLMERCEMDPKIRAKAKIKAMAYIKNYRVSGPWFMTADLKRLLYPINSLLGLLPKCGPHYDLHRLISLSLGEGGIIKEKVNLDCLFTFLRGLPPKDHEQIVIPITRYILRIVDILLSK